jgi:hypothetical protein
MAAEQRQRVPQSHGRVGWRARVPRLQSSGAAGGQLPRYDGKWTTWLSPAGDGALRVRQEHPWDLTSEAVVLHPDGRIGEFESIDGFGVLDSELTDQALADRAAHERHAREVAEQEPEREQQLEEEQTRFRTGNLIRTVAARPGQVPTGPVVAYVALYTTGAMINYLVPRPSQEEPWMRTARHCGRG